MFYAVRFTDSCVNLAFGGFGVTVYMTRDKDVV